MHQHSVQRPPGRIATVCITFDNLGEAAELEYERWPAGVPVGRHPSVTEGLPAIRKVLRRHAVEATFFVEGWNADHYPDGIRALAAEGHEIGCHGWRHENWSGLTAANAENLITRSLAAFRALSVPCRGFRPPGGLIPEAARGALAHKGLSYVSPLGNEEQVQGDLAVLPFGWPHVDATYFEPLLGELRQAHLGRQSVSSPADWQAALSQALARTLAESGFLTVIFHPYLLANEPERLRVFDWFVEQCAARADIRVERCTDRAAQLRAQNSQPIKGTCQ
jgi:peptidoglycan-N-acetylglucosamine deacetylase